MLAERFDVSTAGPAAKPRAGLPTCTGAMAKRMPLAAALNPSSGLSMPRKTEAKPAAPSAKAEKAPAEEAKTSARKTGGDAA